MIIELNRCIATLQTTLHKKAGATETAYALGCLESFLKAMEVGGTKVPDALQIESLNLIKEAKKRVGMKNGGR